MVFSIGDLVSFSYPLRPNTRAHDPYPRVLILHPNWQGLVHGLNFNYLSNDEINTIRMLIDPFYEMKYRDALKRKNPKAFQELEAIITTPVQFAGMSVRNAKMSSPQEFYRGVIRPFIMQRGWDPYRKYRADKVRHSRIVSPARVIMGEESLAKWRGEKDELVQELERVLKEAVTPEQEKKVKETKQKLEFATSMSQRKSALAKMAEFLQFWRGPRGPRFGR